MDTTGSCFIGLRFGFGRAYDLVAWLLEGGGGGGGGGRKETGGGSWLVLVEVVVVVLVVVECKKGGRWWGPFLGCVCRMFYGPEDEGGRGRSRLKLICGWWISSVRN